MEFTTRQLSRDDVPAFTDLVRLFEQVFEMRDFSLPPQEHLADVLKNEHFMAFVAEDRGGQIVGGLTAYTLPQYYSVKPLSYVFDLAVRADVQRRGIGRALMEACNKECKRRGFEEVFVQADADDGHALRFYEALKGNPEQVVHFTYPL